MIVAAARSIVEAVVAVAAAILMMIGLGALAGWVVVGFRLVAG